MRYRKYFNDNDTKGQREFFDSIAGHITGDSGAVTLPWAMLGVVGYMIYWMIAHGIFHALTALQGVR